MHDDEKRKREDKKTGVEDDEGDVEVTENQIGELNEKEKLEIACKSFVWLALQKCQQEIQYPK